MLLLYEPKISMIAVRYDRLCIAEFAHREWQCYAGVPHVALTAVSRQRRASSWLSTPV